MAQGVSTEEARAMIDADFALTKITSVEIADDRVVIHSRRDTNDGLGFYAMTITPCARGGLDVATRFDRKPPNIAPPDVKAMLRGLGGP